MSTRALLPALAAAALLAGCTGSSKEGVPPARLDGTWFGSWAGVDEFGFPLGSGFYFVLDHDEDAGLLSGTAFSSVAGPGTLIGQVDGARFSFDVTYESGDTESYGARAEFGTIENGDYEGTIAGEPFDGEFSMFPSEIAPKGTTAGAGLVSGKITTGGGTTPVQGATVSIGVGAARQETVTNAAGDYSFSFVSGGPRVLVASAPGGETAYVPIVVNGTVAVPDIILVPASAPAGPPVIELAQALDGASTSSSVVFATGQVSSGDAPFVVASVNGVEYLVPLDAGDFSYALILSRGVNTVVFQAMNQVGITERTALANADVLPQKIRVTMVWDQGVAADGSGDDINDQDLHLWHFGPGGTGGQHASYVEPAGVNNGILDVDNTFGFGPENYTMNAAAAGTYYVAVNFFDGSVTTNVIVRVSLNENTPDERVYFYGPELMTVANQNSGYPVTVTTDSWWRVADIAVDATGLATLAPGTNPDTTFALPD